MTASSTPLFTRKSIIKLLIPLFIEQILAILIGLFDTMMVSSSGEAAVSGVSLVDQINILLIQFFGAMASGGAIVISQYIGRRDEEHARSTARQLFWLVLGISLFFMSIVIIGNQPILRLIYGDVDADVLSACTTYFYLTAISFPFLGIYNVCSSVFRSMGNTKISMVCSFFMNLLNFGGNALFIYGFHWSVFGAGLSTLISRAASAIYVFIILCKPKYEVHLQGLLHTRFDKHTLLAVLRVGLPSGVENSVFQIGKLMVARLVSTFGTVSIAANAVAGNICTFVVLPGSAIGLSLLPIVGQSIGAGDFTGAKRYTRKLMLVGTVGITVTGALVLLFLHPLIGLYHLSAEATAYTVYIMRMYTLTAIVFHAASFSLPNALRAAGDARYTMIVSICSMWLCRIVAAYFFANTLGFALYGVWYAMFLDWIVRGAFFVGRFCGSKWLQKKVI